MNTGGFGLDLAESNPTWNMRNWIPRCNCVSAVMVWAVRSKINDYDQNCV